MYFNKSCFTPSFWVVKILVHIRTESLFLQKGTECDLQDIACVFVYKVSSVVTVKKIPTGLVINSLWLFLSYFLPWRCNMLLYFSASDIELTIKFLYRRLLSACCCCGQTATSVTSDMKLCLWVHLILFSGETKTIIHTFIRNISTHHMGVFTKKQSPLRSPVCS